MSDLTWREAIVTVLRENPGAMHYSDIAQAIADKKLRVELGATPAASVASIISASLQNESTDSPFIRVERGRYWLGNRVEVEAKHSLPMDQVTTDAGLINAYGMYWSRDRVHWSSSPSLLGHQQAGSTVVDFAGQRGVYLLHDHRAVVYVGRASEQSMATRLKQHLLDRLEARWNRFSWFGAYSVAESGALNLSDIGVYSLDMLISTMEALLIEGLEPPQNRKRGDDFRAVEFSQVEDPRIKRGKFVDLIDEFKSKF